MKVADGGWQNKPLSTADLKNLLEMSQDPDVCLDEFERPVLAQSCRSRACLLLRSERTCLICRLEGLNLTHCTDLHPGERLAECSHWQG